MSERTAHRHTVYEALGLNPTSDNEFYVCFYEHFSNIPFKVHIRIILTFMVNVCILDRHSVTMEFKVNLYDPVNNDNYVEDTK